VAGWALGLCIAWVLAALVFAAARGAKGARAGRIGLFHDRLRSPTVYLFSGYLLIAALVTPLSPGETTSPLLWLAAALPVWWAVASLASIGAARASLAGGLGLAALYGGAVLAGALLILQLASPAFVPAWSR